LCTAATSHVGTEDETAAVAALDAKAEASLQAAAQSASALIGEKATLRLQVGGMEAAWRASEAQLRAEVAELRVMLATALNELVIDDQLQMVSVKRAAEVNGALRDMRQVVGSLEGTVSDGRRQVAALEEERQSRETAVAWQLEAVEAEKAAATAEAARLKVVLDARTASAALAGIQARVAATQAIAQAAEALERLEAEHEVMAASLRDADLERARESELASTQMATHAEALGHVRRALAHARTLASVHAAHHGGVARHRKSAHLAQKLLKEAWWRPSLHTTLQGLQPKVCALPPPAWEPYQLRSTPRAEKLLERACHPGYGILRFSQPVQLR